MKPSGVPPLRSDLSPPGNVPDDVAARLTELEAFCLRAGRRPSPASTDAQEKSLAQWVQQMRRRRRFRPFIDEVIYQWPLHDPTRVEQFRAFCILHGHRPSRRSQEPAEASLARWAAEAKLRPVPDPGLTALLEQYPSRAEATGTDLRACLRCM